jgi:hypothetical protein
MRPLYALTLVLCLTCCALADSPLQQSAVKLYESLSAEHRKAVTLPFDSPERTSQVFPPGKRPGIQLKDLSEEQRNAAIGLVKQFTSDYGFEKAEAITKQGAPGGWGRFYLTYFGEPGANKTYAWRIAEHHLTIVNVEFENGEVKAVGPILLGANPPTLWDEEELKMIELYATLSPSERTKAVKQPDPKHSASSVPIGDGGIKVGELTTDSKKKVQEIFDGRLKFFAPDIAERVRKIVEKAGGIDAMNVVFYGYASKKCSDGGKWDFKLGSASFLCDYENTRGHIHMSLKGRPKEQ